MAIACIGITVLDRIQQVSKLPVSGGKYVAHNYIEVGGGPAATASVAVAKLGHEVDFIGRVGCDAIADTMLTELASYQVGINRVVKIPNASSAFSAILVDDQGERIIVNYQDPSLLKDASPLKKVDFSQYSTVLADVRWIEGAKYAFEQAKLHHIPSVLDADITPEPIDELVALASHVAFSQPGLAKFSNTNDPVAGLRIAQEKTKGIVYVTVGSQGCYWIENGVLHHQEGLKVDVIDTTGAGDVFHGALAVAVAERMSLQKSIIFSNTVAALKCTKLGGREGIPSREEVNQIISDTESKLELP